MSYRFAFKNITYVNIYRYCAPLEKQCVEINPRNLLYNSNDHIGIRTSGVHEVSIPNVFDILLTKLSKFELIRAPIVDKMCETT